MRIIKTLILTIVSVASYAQCELSCESIKNCIDADYINSVVIPSSENIDFVQYSTNNTIPTGTPPDGVDTYVLDNGTRYDWDGTQWVELVNATCQIETTRAAVIALRNAGNLEKDCHYVITNPNANGTLLLDKVLIHAVDENTLSGCYLKTAHDNTAWVGSYDIDLDRVIKVFDHLRRNKLSANNSVVSFPYSCTTCTDNEIHNTPITYTAGSFYDNEINGATQLIVGGTSFYGNEIGSNTNINFTGGTFFNNNVSTDATVVMSGGSMSKNNINSISRVTVTAGTFRENTVENESVVTSSSSTVEENRITGRGTLTITAGNFARNDITSQARVNTSKTDVYRNNFASYSNVILSGSGNLEDSSISDESTYTNSSTGITYQLNMESNSRLTQTGSAAVQNTSINNNSQVTFISGSSYNNTFSERSVYNQVGTGYIRYSRISGQATFTNGNVNVSNLNSYVTAINLTGATGDIINSEFQYGIVNATNCPQLFIRHSNVSQGGTVTANSATRFYMYRSTASNYGRFLISTGSRIDASYTTATDGGYIQSSVSGGFLTCNYSRASNGSYIRNTTPNSNSVNNSQANTGGRISFEGTATGGRVYNSRSSASSSIVQSTGSVGCYMYYVTADGVSQITSSNSTNLRMYYSSAAAYSYLRSINNPATHYMYYCNSDARGYVQMLNNIGVCRMYAINAEGQSIAELRGSTGNLYYSSFSAYFYAYITRTGNSASLGLFGMGRRTQTLTNPTTVTPFAAASGWMNF